MLFADLDFGKSLLDDKLFDEAIQEFEKIIAAAPTTDQAQEAMFLSGEAYREKGEYLQAETFYKKLIEGYPTLLFRDKVLFYLGKVQLEQNKFEEATKNFETLLNDFPLTDFAKNSISLYLEAIYKTGNYRLTIEKSDEMMLAYPGHYDLPEFSLWQAKAFFANRKPEEGKRVLNSLISDFPKHPARWKAISIQTDLMKKTKDSRTAANYLNEKMQETEIPRIYEEELRYKLATFFLEVNDRPAAYEELKKLTEKFNNSADLDKYLLEFTKIQLRLRKFKQVIANYSNNLKVFKNSELQAEYELLYAEAVFEMKQHERAREIIKNVLTYSAERLIEYKANFLKSKILESEGRFLSALEELQKLLTYENISKTDVLFSIGNIYFEKFENYQSALKYYQMILTNYSDQNQQHQAMYRIALCYEILKEYEKALQELEQIDLEQLADENFRKKIIQKKDNLKKFKLKDHEKAFENLLAAMYNYFENENKQEFQKRIIQIYNEDLKEFEKSLEIIAAGNSPQEKYQKSLIYLKLAERELTEARSDLAQEFIRKADRLAAELPQTEFPKWRQEIDIKKKLITKDTFDQALITEMEQFIAAYGNENSADQFRLLVANHYLKNDQLEKAVNLIQKMQKSKAIDAADFYQAKITLAEYFYEKNENQQALKNYQLAEKFIDLNKPTIYFHYAVVLYETGKQQKAKKMLSFLLQNAEKFDYYDNAIDYISRILIQEKDYSEAIKFMLFKPLKSRDNKFYEKLADNYLKIDEKKNAKSALQNITEKSTENLRLLAKLQFETGELEAAKSSYQKLLEENDDDLAIYQKLAEIAMQQEEYLEAAENYKRIIDDLGEEFSSYQNIAQIAKNNIIALYRIENRPKAENLNKKFDNVLTEEMQADIQLNEGIYYSKVNEKKAISIFSKLIKKKETPPKIIIKAYFQRGLVFLKQEELEKAKADFLTVSKSFDQQLRNQADLKLGTINFSNENYQEALLYYSKVIENDNDGILAFDAARNFAYVCKTMKEWQKAIAAYELILERWGDKKMEAETLFDIAFSHFRDKKYEKAIEIFEKALPLLEKEETKAEAQYWIGESYFGKEAYERAVAEFLKVRYSYGNVTEWAASAELRVGEVYLKMGKLPRVKETYQRVIERYGKFSQWGEEAQKRLEVLQ